MELRYSRQKTFEPEQLGQLFQSVGWQSGARPDKLVRAMEGASRVISAWEGDRLVGLIRGLDDGVWQGTIDCLLVHRDDQGRGIAAQLLAMMKEEYRELLYVSVMPEERENVPFYEKYGFQVMAEGTAMQRVRPGWFDQAEDDRQIQ